jgi:hypothetical protein
MEDVDSSPRPPEDSVVPQVISPDLGVFLLFSALCLCLVALRPLNYLADDALFYLVIADHLAAGHGSTFNGLFPTNGYHPLWEACAALVALLPHTRESLLRYGLMTQWLFGAVTFWVLSKSLRPFLGRSAMAAFLGVWITLFVAAGNLYWTEAPLAMLLAAVVMTTLLREGAPPYGLLGLVLGLLFLSRLDTVFLIGCVFVGLWLRDRDWKLGVAAAICAGIAGAYVAANIMTFGHATPISGAIKSAFYRHTFFTGLLGPNGMISLAGAVGLALVVGLRRSRPRRYRFAMLILAAGVILQSLYVVVLTYGDTTWAWYYVQGYLCVAVLAAEIADGLPRLGPVPIGKAVLALCVAVSVGLAGMKFIYGYTLHDPVESGRVWRAHWLDLVQQTLPEDRSVLVVFDQPGLFAYGTSHPVLSLDGLTSNYAFDARLGRRGMYAQLSELGQGYLIAPLVADGVHLRSAVTSQIGVPGGQIVHFAAPLSGKDAGCIRVDTAALVATLPVPHVFHTGDWGVWRLTPATLHPAQCQDEVPARSPDYLSQS